MWAIDVNSQVGGQFTLFVPPIVSVAAFPSTIPAPADFDTDGQAVPAVFTIVDVGGVGYGVFTIDHNEVAGGNRTVESVAWGLAGDTPVSGDFDGSGKAQVAVYRPSTGAWYIRSSGLGVGVGRPAGKSELPVVVTPPLAGDVPDAADYDGVGRLEEAVYRPGTETFFIYNSGTKATRAVTMPKLAGQGAGDVIIPASADFSGDGKADPAIFDQTLGTFEYFNTSTNKFATQAFFLTKGDIPLTAPESYRAAVGATPSFRTAGAFLATPAGTASAPGSVAPASTGKATAAVVVGASAPTGLTSTGKATALPPAPAPSPAPVILITSGSSASPGPPSGDATDEAIQLDGRLIGRPSRRASTPRPARAARRGVAARRAARRWRGRGRVSTLVGSGRWTAPDRATDARPMTAPERPFLTVVSGLPRSGTSLMMKMLEAGGLPVLVDNVREADVDNPRGYYEFEPVKALKSDASWVAPALGKAVKMVYLLLMDLPADQQYRVLLMRRNIEVVIASQRAMLDRMGKPSPLDDARMAALFRDGLARFEAWAGGRPNFRLLDVSYNALVTDAAPVVAEVDRFLGGGLDRDAMARVVDPALYRNRGA